ncbi:hypothetical protein A2V82_13645 [candidate division KSB1 bacterium RBG_16_48_16]|nr:MAG: hypothetical protein A2V82_13645 [candidate division KSB1 bacterium RBG_16_48_16]
MSRKIIHSLFILIAASVMWSCSKTDSSTSESETQVPVETATIKKGDFVHSLFYDGDINAEYEVKVFSKVPDRIEHFYVDAGDKVGKGAPIARIVATTLEQTVQQAEAGLTAARAQLANVRLEYERMQRLRKENAVSQQQYDAVETQYEAVGAQVQQTEAALASTQSILKDATVTAPISGIIGKRYYEAGDMAAPILPLVSIVQMDKVKITFDATEEDLGKLAVGQKAEVRVKSYPDVTFSGSVAKISPVLDPLTRMAEIEVLVDNPQHKLKPGMYAEVQVTTRIINDVIVIPRYAVIENTSLEKVEGKDVVVRNYFVYVVKNGKAEQRTLDVEFLNHTRIAVRAGVSVDENLVVDGQNKLRDGAAVVVTTREDVKS